MTPEKRSGYQEASPEEISKLKTKVLADRGFDLAIYTPSYVQRRVNACLMKNNSSLDQYLLLLDSEPGEYQRFLDGLTVNVTEFFRDPPFWALLQKEVFPKMLAKKRERNDRTVRIWSAGCSSGEEPYSIAMTLRELMGKDWQKNWFLNILATDIDDEALDKAREGIYHLDTMKNLPQNLMGRYFAPAGSGLQTPRQERFKLSDEIMRMVHFSKKHFFDDEPHQYVDAIFCRNAMIYVTSRKKEALLETFYRSLNADGLLVLGKSETLAPSGGYCFDAVNSAERIFSKSEDLRPETAPKRPEGEEDADLITADFKKEGGAKKMAKVLVVDDSRFMRLTLKQLLIQCGHQVIGEAEDAPSAVLKYKELKPDLVTMDVIMPVDSGLQAVEEIIKADPAAKIIMVSAMGQDKIINEAASKGAKGFITKPITLPQLKEALNKIL